MTALGAYLIGDVINAAYVDKNLTGIIVLALVTAIIFMIKGMATYGQALMLARIGNRIVAINQRRMFDALIQQNVGFFAERHSSEFLARLTTGAAAASQVINLLVTAIGRDLLSLIGLVAVMAIQDPIMSLFSFVVVPPALHHPAQDDPPHLRNIARNQFTGGARILETMQETVQGIRIVKAFTLEDVMLQRLDANIAELEHESNKWARVAHRASPLMEALGGFAIAHRADLRRLPRAGDRRDAGPVLLVPRRLHAGLRAGQAAGAAEHRSEHRPGRRAHPVRDHRHPADRAERRRQAAAQGHHGASRVQGRALWLPAAARRCHPRHDVSSPSPAR